jgi:site-specific DNA-methyltransferase (adenine-specific)
MKPSYNHNDVILGDCFSILDDVSPNSVDLVYLDPPFFTQKQHSLTTRDGGQYYNFSDIWNDIEEYSEHIKVRIEKCKSVLKESGSLFLHCDKSASHYLRVVADTVFGRENFQSEIIWSYKRWSNSKKGLLNNHQTIFFYSKTKNFKFNQKYDGYSPSTNIDQIVQIRERDGRNKAVYKKHGDGSPVLCSEKRGVPMGDVWDIPYLNPKARERVSYPTQKPILLLERIIELVTDEGDLVIDPYCGSGTTLVAAKILKRNFLGIDQNEDAVALARTRLANPIKSESNLLKKGRDSYARTDREVIEAIIKIGAILVQRNKGIDGLATVLGQMVPIKVVIGGEELEDAAESLHRASKKNNYAVTAIYAVNGCAIERQEKVEREYGVLVFQNFEELEIRIAAMKPESLRGRENGLHTPGSPAEV